MMPRPTDAKTTPMVAQARKAGVGHLILWITCCAVYLGLVRGLLRDERGITVAQFLVFNAIAAYNGLCWAASIVVIYRHLGSSRLRTDPGEWAMFCVGVILALDVGARFLPDQFVIRPAAIAIAGTCGVLVVPTLSRRLPGEWKLFFAILVLLYAVPLCAVLGDAFDFWPRGLPLARFLNTWRIVRPVAVLIVAARVLVVDRKSNRHYSWSHWLGLGCIAIWVLRTSIKPS